VAKERVSALAKQVGKTSKELIDWLNNNGEYVKTPSSTIEAPVVAKVFAAFPKVEVAGGDGAAAPSLPAASTFGKAASTFATTGASIVDDGVLTYSPLLLSHSMSSFEVFPTSLASADTRALATNSPSVARGYRRKPLSVHGATHRCWLIERSSW